jgi:hypothetical protein
MSPRTSADALHPWRARRVLSTVPQITRLAWQDADLGALDLPKGRLAIRSGFGSGLSRRPADPLGRVWAVCDRGPNIKLKPAVEQYGLEELAPYLDSEGAKLMPRLDLGPALAELQVEEDRVVLIRSLRLRTSAGKPLSGLPMPGPHAVQEPAFGLGGEELGTDATGADTEGVAAVEGGFWVVDEYGPSLLRVDEGGAVIERRVPEGCEPLEDCGYRLSPRLPAIAAKRQLNRGLEAMAADGERLWIAFQSPLAHPDLAAHKAARHLRIWRLDASSGAVEAQFLYPLDPPETFRRDVAKGEVEWGDLKVSEMAHLGGDAMIVLERGSETTKLYRVDLAPGCASDARHLDAATRPTIEEMSGAGAVDQPVLEKTLLFSTDDAPEVAPDLEGMVLLAPDELLLSSDNDFGVDGAETTFWRLRFDGPIA